MKYINKFFNYELILNKCQFKLVQAIKVLHTELFQVTTFRINSWLIFTMAIKIFINVLVYKNFKE